MDASAWDERYASAELVWSIEPNRFVVEQSTALPPGSVLDLACGEGRNAIWFAGRGWSATGIDYSAVAVAKAAELARANHVHVSWLQGDVLDLTPVPVWDLVLLSYLHLPRPHRHAVIELTAQAVKPGGSLLVIGHDRRNIAEGVGGPQDPDVLWTPDEISPTGFTDVRRETAIRPTNDGDALDTVVHLVRSATG